jgi:serine protease Do
VEKASNAVVSIMATEPIRRPETIHDEFFRFFFGDQLPRENVNMGSGFVISEDGLVVTNQHVIGIDPK